MDYESRRLKALKKYKILDTDPEEPFENLASLAKTVSNTSSAQINFIGENRQWAKTNIGFGKKEIPKKFSFCVHAIQSKDATLVVKDAKKDKRFKNNPLVYNDPPLRFYAGVSIKSVNDMPIGTICVFDSKPNNLSEKQIDCLNIIANEIETHLKLRLGNNELKKMLFQEDRLNKKIINHLPINFFMYNSLGEITRWNNNLINTTGYTSSEIVQMSPKEYFAEQDQDKVEKVIGEVLDGKEKILESSIKKKNGTFVPVLLSLSRIKINDELFLIGTGQDISDQKNIQQELQKLLDLFSKFVPTEFIRLLNKDSLTEVKHGDQIQENVSILFADIRGFTSISETLSTEDNFRLLNTFLKRIGPCIRKNNGVIDKYMGDGILALFPNKASDAVNASIQMHQTIAEYNVKRRKSDQLPLNFNIGIHHGEVQLGIIGDETRYQATVISDDVNQTFRIEELANKFDAPLLISDRVHSKLNNEKSLNTRKYGSFIVKGKELPITLHEVIDADTRDSAKLKIKTLKPFNDGINYFSKGHYADAIQKLGEVLKFNPDDTATKIHINKAMKKLTDVSE